MDWIALTVIIVYLAGVTIAGSLLAGRNKVASDWAVAGGGMGLVMVAIGIAGTRIGGGGTYGVAGNVISGGVWYAWWYAISTFLAMALVGGFFAKPYRRLQLHTVGQIFNVRFGSSRSQAMTSLCVQTEYLIVNVLEAYIIGIILTGVTGLPMSITVTIAAVVLISYVVMGGLWGTAVTNIIHCGAIIFGLGAVGLLGINRLGGWDSIVVSVDGFLAQSATMTETRWWAFLGGGWGAVIGLVFSTAIHTPAASVYTNYASSAKTEKSLLPAFLLAGIIGGSMPLLSGLIGVQTLAQYGPERGFGGYQNITALATDINPIIGGIALAAILAAVISSGGPILLSSATMFVRDWLWFTRDYSEERKLLAYRIATIVYGIVAAILAWMWRTFDPGISILDILLFGFAMVVPPAIAVGFLIYWRRTTEPAAFWGMVIGYAAGLIWYILIRYAIAINFTVEEGDPLWREVFHFCFIYHGKGLDPSYLTTIVPLIVIPVISLMTPPVHDDRADPFYERLRKPR